MRTALCDELGIEFPILAFSHCRDVVAAVSKAGGFGVLGAVEARIDGRPVVFGVSDSRFLRGSMGSVVGEKFTRAVELATQEKLPFVFVSGTIGEDRAVDAMRRGATDYVLKDRMHRLIPVIQRALKEARERTARRRAQEALEESEARFRSFMQHLPGRASIRDLEGRCTYVSAGGRRCNAREFLEFGRRSRHRPKEIRPL